MNLYLSYFLLLSRPVLLLTVASKSACVGLSVSHGRECLLQPASWLISSSLIATFKVGAT